MVSFDLAQSADFGSVNQFLDLVAASGLINEKRLAAVVDEFKKEGGRPFMSRFGLSITGVTGYLVHRGFLTCWQVQMLRRGKVKGFFYENELLLLDCWSDGANEVYLANRRSNSDTVVVQFTQAAADKPYRILKVLDRSSLSWVDDSPRNDDGGVVG